MNKMIDLVVDAEANNLLPMVDTIWCVVVKILDAPADDEKSFRVCRTREELLKIINSGRVGKVIFHNGLGYDLWTISRVWDIPFHLSADGKSDTWNGQPVTFIDTFQISSYLNPDREGGHSLEAFGQKLGFPKGSHSDFTQFSEDMLEYCKQDVRVTELTYQYLLKEWEKRQRD